MNPNNDDKYKYKYTELLNLLIKFKNDNLMSDEQRKKIKSNTNCKSIIKVT